MKKALFYGILSSVFFAFTFVLNRSMNLSGGNWMWTSSLRFLFMLPLLYMILLKQNGIINITNSIKNTPLPWFIWSTIGFGLFYTPLTFASVYGQSWIVAGCWQITIVAGILLTPIFKKKLPIKNLLMCCIILLGVFLIQYEQASTINLHQVFFSTIPIVIAAFAYPLGNRKMMELCKNSLSTTERVFGMTLCSMPFWLILSFIAYKQNGLPSINQITQSIIVAIFSGIIATLLFFKATELVKNNPTHLAIVEATQSGEVIFSVLGEIFILGGSIPSLIGFTGLLLIIIGIILNSITATISN